MSITGSNANNPLAYLQLMQQQQGSSPNGATPQSDPLSALLAAIGPQGTGANGSGSGATANTTGVTSTAGGSSPQFDPQTLQALLAQQSNGPSPQTLASQLEGSGSDSDIDSTQQSQQSQGQRGHHRHHHAGGGADGASNSNGNLLEQLAQMQSQLTTPTPAPTQTMTV